MVCRSVSACGPYRTGVRVERDDGAGVVAGADDFDRSERLAFGVSLHEHLSLAVNLGDEAVGEGVDAGDADAVETAGDLVAVL